MRKEVNTKFDMKNEKGAISLFVVLAMLFFLVFMTGAYTMISRRNQEQAETMAELKNTYKTDGEAQYDSLVGSSEIQIPIATKDNYYLMITGNDIYVNGVTYKATEDAKYKIVANIEIPMSDISNYIDTGYAFKDYVTYSDSYNVEKSNGMDVYYTFNNEKYKLLVYNENGDILDSDNKTSGTSTNFSMYSEVNSYSTTPYEFLVYICKDGQDNFKTMVENSNYFTSTVSTTLPKLTELECVKNNVDSGDKYYLFVKYKAPSNVNGKKLSTVVNIGDYVKYKLDYSNLLTTDSTSLDVGWRVISKEYDSSTGKTKVKLISEYTPIEYTYNSISYQKDLYDNFENYTFSTSYDNKNIVKRSSVKGSFFRNAYAESVSALDYDTLSIAVTGSSEFDLIDKAGGVQNIKLANGYGNLSNYYTDVKENLLANGTSYWVGMINSYFYYANSEKTDVTLDYVSNSQVVGIRPVVTLIDNLEIVDGNGSKSNPYDIRITEISSSGPKVGDYVLYSGVGTYGDYSNPFNYRNVTIDKEKSSLEGWRILDIADDGTIKIISGGIPLKYSTNGKNKDTILSELGTNFESTTFTRVEASAYYTGRTTEVKGSEFLNSLYAQNVKVFDYEELSNAVYDNPEYLTVSLNYGLGSLNETSLSGNTVDEDKYEYVINNWFTNKKGLINVGADYILGTEVLGNIGYVDNEKYITSTAVSEIGVRVVVTLKSTTKFMSGTGTNTDPYVLSSDASSDVGEFKIGDYVKYDGMVDYSNVTNLSDSKKGQNITQTGWRVFSYENGTLKLISAGIPFSARLFDSRNAPPADDYAEYVKGFKYNNISIYDSNNNRVANNYNPLNNDIRIKSVESIDISQYQYLLNLYNNNQVSEDLIYLNGNYWLGSYVTKTTSNTDSSRTENQLQYVARDSVDSVAERKNYGIRVIITITDEFTTTINSGTQNDPHILTFK